MRGGIVTSLRREKLWVELRSESSARDTLSDKKVLFYNSKRN
jgi:hypothetical protein